MAKAELKKKNIAVIKQTSKEDREKALQMAIAQIEKQFGAGAVMRLGQNSVQNVEAISTGSLSLDMALGIGGVPRGRIVEIYGPESSGKTTVALQIIAEAQKNGGEAAFIDVEQHSIRFMRRHSASTSMICLCRSRTAASRHSRLQRHSCAPARLMSSSLTLSRL